MKAKLHDFLIKEEFLLKALWLESKKTEKKTKQKTTKTIKEKKQKDKDKKREKEISTDLKSVQLDLAQNTFLLSLYIYDVFYPFCNAFRKKYKAEILN